MSKFQAIEKALVEINDAIFQELCDKLIFRYIYDISGISRTGSQIDKQKTRKGTPDTFILKQNGNYIYIESTTNSTDKHKLEKDIKACFDVKKSKLSSDKIEKIILCFNFKIAKDETERLNLLAKSFNKDVIVEYWSLDWIAFELDKNHRDLISEYLNLPFDSGQIVSIERFIKEYNRATGLATPLDNVFLYREDEKKKIINAINEFDIVIITGVPGVGKTRLVLETMKEYQKNYKNYTSYCISNKNYPLLEDLTSYLKPQKDYLLFVDDANRIETFQQVIGFYKSKLKGTLKIIITVRDYAQDEIEKMLLDYNFEPIEIKKMSDEQIVDIIESEPLNILNHKYQDRIVKISDGNPRLALMAALLAKEKKYLASLNDVSSLFEKYFDTFIRDKNELSDEKYMRVLGIIAFFNALSLCKNDIYQVLANFNIKYSDFIDAVKRLEKIEIVNVKFEYVKIEEQNLATFFFYRAFIKDNLLSLEMLLKEYFFKNTNRFRDCLYPAIDIFDFYKVKSIILPVLRKYWYGIHSDSEKSYSFLSFFWFYLKDEILEYVYNKLKDLPTIIVDEYIYDQEKNKTYSNKNKTIELLGELFAHPDMISDSLKISFEYVRKLPKIFTELINKINEIISYESDDERIGFKRQVILFDIIEEGYKQGDNLFKAVFHELAKTFLLYKFEQTNSHRNNKYSWSFYPLPLTQITEKFRENIWKLIIETYSDNFKLLDLLNSYLKNSRDVVKEVMEFDMPFVVKTIEKHLDEQEFEHCKYVQEQIRKFKRNGIYSQKLDRLEKKFRNSKYELYELIKWDWVRDKIKYNITDIGNHEKYMEQLIRGKLIFNSAKEVESFISLFSYLSKHDDGNNYYYHKTLSIVIDENLIRKKEIGFEIIRQIVKNHNEIEFLPYSVFAKHLVTANGIKNIWDIIQSCSFIGKAQWEFSFYETIEKSFIKRYHIGLILKSISEINLSYMIYFERYESYLKLDCMAFIKMLKVISNKNDNKENSIWIWTDLFVKYFNDIKGNIDLVEKSYIQQVNSKQPFDFHFKGLYNILEVDPDFLLVFIKNMYSDKTYGFKDSNRSLSHIWNLKGIEIQIGKAFDTVIERESYQEIDEHFCNCFYRNLDADCKIKADNFLFSYIRRNNANHKKMNIVIDIARNSRKEIFEEVILEYISNNQNPEDFKKIAWLGRGRAYSGGENYGDIKAAKLKKIEAIIKGSPLGIKLLPIKKVIKDIINEYLDDGINVRKRRFLNNDYL